MDPQPVTPEPRRIAIRVPHWSLFLVAGFVLLFTSVGLRLGLPIYQQQVAIREIKQLGARVSARKGGPDWLRDWLGDERMQGFDTVESVNFYETQINDRDLRWCRRLKDLRLALPPA